ncbi:MAG: hypothetical protein WBP79_03505 [Candidatus Acidiferrales bacterium]
MSKQIQFAVLAVILLAGLSLAAGAPAQVKKASGGEEFFLVSSVDLRKSQVLVKRPTEVTLLVKVDDKTQYVDEKGKAIKLADLRAGDTIWIISSAPGADGEPLAQRIRKGPMTVKDLHRLYLDRSSSQ